MVSPCKKNEQNKDIKKGIIVTFKGMRATG
jgi:hypothetical protein